MRMSATKNFFGMIIFIPNQSYRILKFQKYIPTITLQAQILIAIPQKLTLFNLYILLQFLRYQLETW